MHSLLVTLFTFALFTTLLSSPVPSPYTLVQKRSNVPTGWSPTGRFHPASVLPLRFGLTQSNIDNIDDLLLSVSDPLSPNYGNHWSPSRVADTFKPSDESITAVRNWLVDSGIDPSRIRISHQRTWIELNATVEEAERLLRTEYTVYEHHSGTRHVACHSYHLPNHIIPHVDLVTPTIDFTAILNKRGNGIGGIGKPGQGGPKKGPKLTSNVQDNGATNCYERTTIKCLKALYDISYTFNPDNKNSFGIVEYTPQAYLSTDLDQFSTIYAPSNVGKRPTLASTDGGVVQTSQTGFGYNGESDLDLEYAMGLVGPSQQITLYQVGDDVVGGSFNNFLDALDSSYCTYEGGDDPSVDSTYPDPSGYNHPENCGTLTPASVISTSYGYNEADLSPAYAIRQCNEYAKLGLLGVTVLYSSGDNGVAGNGDNCLNPDGSQTSSGTMFNPTFPSVCPYVTSVGATQIKSSSSLTEEACQTVIYSGGGFSNVFKMPGYQKAAVGGWRSHGLPNYPAGTWNSTGNSRAYPDLSANGANYVVAIDGTFNLVYGTSASTPVVGSILTMVNDARISAGKNPIGFINPTIYGSSFSGAFNDITSGSNPGCGTNGFTAVQGWDPVTGLGTPNFPVLLNKFLALP